MVAEHFTVICKARYNDELRLEFNLRSMSIIDANASIHEIVRKNYKDFYRDSNGIFEWMILNRKMD